MALPADVNYSDKNVRVFTRGLRATVKALEEAGADAQDMKEVFASAGRVVLRKVHYPIRTSRLQASVRLGTYKNKATIKAGRKAVPYAARIEYGAYLTLKDGSKSRIQGHLVLREAVRRGKHEALTTIQHGVEKLCRQHNVPCQVKLTRYVVTRIGKNGMPNAAYSSDSQYTS
jgi:hypothetical protein